MNEPVFHRDIVVIGGSLGAPQALQILLAKLPVMPEAAVFVVLHMPPYGGGISATVRMAAAHHSVVEAQHGMDIEPGRIYLAVPDRHLMLERGRIALGRGPRENLSRPSIDALFRSAAMHYGPRVIGVVLSGMLNDGSAGLHAVRRCGGVALVQDPADALAGDMPTNALRAVEVDACAPASQLPELIVRRVREPAGQGPPIPDDLRFEVDVAMGGRSDPDRLASAAVPSPVTCPSCGGVMSEMKGDGPLRYRCQVGHAMTADVLAREQESAVDEALRVALRMVEERAELVARMAADALRHQRLAIAEGYRKRSDEYRRHAETIRRAVLASMERDGGVA
ncbi:chemotaxis protein CheB [Luteibacter sp. CQ10]|uniref:chemotaxis protein CheB n=1 Tax=Luteibacter sp. CQ10 TaxID=2805821 RepID=UPI0034A21C35